MKATDEQVQRIIGQARAAHDLVCACDPKYVMSCPRMAAAILAQSGPAPNASEVSGERNC